MKLWGAHGTEKIRSRLGARLILFTGYYTKKYIGQIAWKIICDIGIIGFQASKNQFQSANSSAAIRFFPMNNVLWKNNWTGLIFGSTQFLYLMLSVYKNYC